MLQNAMKCHTNATKFTKQIAALRYPYFCRAAENEAKAVTKEQLIFFR
jgi:hypothetical protein